MPVIHNMQNHEVDTLIQAGYKYVAIGRQQNKTNPSVLIPAVVKLLSHGVLSHLFGITDFNLLVSCPAASCDSKSWLDDANTGVVRFWNPAKPGENKTDILYFPDKQGKTKQGTHVYTRNWVVARRMAYVARLTRKHAPNCRVVSSRTSTAG